jgi:hypothetical protein
MAGNRAQVSHTVQSADNGPVTRPGLRAGGGKALEMNNLANSIAWARHKGL